MNPPIPPAERALFDLDGLLLELPREQSEGVNRYFNSLPESDRPAAKQKLSSMLAIHAQSKNLSLEEIDRRWESIRRGVAHQYGWANGGLDDAAFHGELMKQADLHRQERWRIQGLDDENAPDAKQWWEASLVCRVRKAAQVGGSYGEALVQWEEENRGQPGFDESRLGKYADLARKEHERMAEIVQKVRPRADQIYDAVARSRGVLENRGDQPVSLAPIQYLRDLTPEERGVAYQLMEERAGDGPDKSSWEGLGLATGEALGRGFENLLLGGSAHKMRGIYLGMKFQAGDAVMEDFESEYAQRVSDLTVNEASFEGQAMADVFFPRRQRKLTEAEAQEWNQRAAERREDIDLVEEMRKFGQTKIDPTNKSGNWFRRKVWLPTMDSAAVMASAAIPYAWPLTLEHSAQSYANDHYLELRAKGMKAEEAHGLSLVSGFGQAALDKLGVGLLTKGAPALTRQLRQFALGGRGGMRLAGNFVGTLGGETGIELMQDFLIPALVEDILASDPQFDVKWIGVLEDAAKATPDIMAGMLLLSGLGGIAQTRQQSAYVRALSANATAMRLQDYSLEQIAEIQAAPEAERGALLAQYLPAKAPEGEARERLLREAAVLARQERTAFAEQQRAEAIAGADAANQAVEVTRSGAGWWVHFADKSVRVEEAEVARRMRDDLAIAATEREAETLIAEANSFVGDAAADTEARAIFRGETVRATEAGLARERGGEVTLEPMTEGSLGRLQAETQRLAEMTGHREVNAIVNGMNRVQFREGVARGAKRILQEITIHRTVDAPIFTMVHERAEAALRTLWEKAGRGETGGWSLEATQRALAALAPSFDPTRASETERGLFEQVQRVARGEANLDELRETVVELVTADVVRRRKDGTPFGGRMKEALRAAIDASRDPREVAALGQLRATIHALQTYFRAVLSTVAALRRAQRAGQSADFEALVDRLMGRDEQFVSAEQSTGETDSSASETDASKAEAREAEIAYSLSPFSPPAFITRSFNKRIDAWEKTGEAGREPISLGVTPPVLQVAGAEGHSLFMPPGILEKVTKDVHAVSVEALRALPESLADPVAVFQSRTRADSIVVLTEFMEGGNPVIAAIHLDKQAGRGVLINEVASYYGKRAEQVAQMFAERPLYVNQEKCLALARRARLQLPGRGTPTRGGEKIAGPEEVVKWAKAKAEGVTDGGLSFSLRVERQLDELKKNPAFDRNEKIGTEGLTVGKIVDELRQRARAFDRQKVLDYVRELRAMPNAELFLDEAGEVVRLHDFVGQFQWLENKAEPFGLREGGEFDPQKKNIPKTSDRLPVFPDYGTPNEVEDRIVVFMRQTGVVIARDGVEIQVANPQGGSLAKRARHWMGSHAAGDPYKLGDRDVMRTKISSIAAIPSTLRDGQVKASLADNFIYLRRYADGSLHAVWTDASGCVNDHGFIGVRSQYVLGPKQRIEGAKIIEDWTGKFAPAPPVNQQAGAGVVRASAPGRAPENQQGSTPNAQAHGYLDAEGNIVKEPPAPN